MKYKTHTIGGMLAGVILIQAFPSPHPLILIASATIGGLLPDLDHSGSYLGRRIKPVSKGINKLFGHRGITHAPMIISILFLILHLLFKLEVPLFLGLWIGSLSHVFLDALTVSGVPLFYPLSKKKISLLPLKTGGMGEVVITVTMSLLLFYLFAGKNGIIINPWNYY